MGSTAVEAEDARLEGIDNVEERSSGGSKKQQHLKQDGANKKRARRIPEGGNLKKGILMNATQATGATLDKLVDYALMLVTDDIKVELARRRNLRKDDPDLQYELHAVQCRHGRRCNDPTCVYVHIF